MVLDIFKHDPTTIAFQSTAFPGVVYSKARAGWMTKLKDLADPRLKGKVVLPPPGDITNGGLFLGLAVRARQGLQGRGPDEGGRRLGGRQHRPERPQVHARLGRDAAAAPVRRGRRGQLLEQPRPARVLRRQHGRGAARAADVYPVNGYLWVPKGAAASGPRPGLHQLAARPRTSSSRTPGRSTTARGASSARASWARTTSTRSLTGSQADYFNYFPNLDQIKAVQGGRLEGVQRRARRSGRTTTPRRSASRLQSQPASPPVSTRRGRRHVATR